MAATDDVPSDTTDITSFQPGLDIIATALFGPARSRATRTSFVHFFVASLSTASGVLNIPFAASSPSVIKTVHVDDFIEWFRLCLPARILLERSFWNIFCENALPFSIPDISKSLIEEEHVFCLQAWLPEIHRHSWKLRFSSSENGESFSAWRGTLLRCGATIIVISDQDGHIFGSFTREEWKLNPSFFGREPCFLFSLAPSVAVYIPTRYNHNYQYLSSGLSTSPTGLGLGGQIGFHGIWLDGNFGEGHCRGAPNCSTFGNPRLSKNETFKISRVEIWELAPRSDTVAQKSKSVLDCNLEDQELLEMAGRPMVSRDVRAVVNPS